MDNIRLIQGDCLEKMKEIKDKSIDLIITDPPYELNIYGGSKNSCFADRKLIREKHIEFMNMGYDYKNVFNEFLRICKIPNLLIFVQISR